MTSLMTREDSVSLSTVLKENEDTYKGYMMEYIRQLHTQVGCDFFSFLSFSPIFFLP